MRHLMIVTTMLVLFSLPDSASAQQEIVLDNVTNSAAGMYLFAGRTHVFNIRYTNLAPGACSTSGFLPNNGFVVSSPDGAKWDHTIGTLTESFQSQQWGQVFVNNFDNPLPGFINPGDGVSPDYVGMGAITLSCGGGMRSGYDDIALEIEIATNIADTNLHICIDKSELGRLNTFQWAGMCRAECNVVPTWAGQKCYTIIPGCCIGRKGNIDLDPFGNVDITDVTLLIDHLFISFPPLACIDEANIDGDPDGKVDIVDLTLLLDHLFVTFPQLPFCQ